MQTHCWRSMAASKLKFSLNSSMSMNCTPLSWLVPWDARFRLPACCWRTTLKRKTSFLNLCQVRSRFKMKISHASHARGPNFKISLAPSVKSLPSTLLRLTAASSGDLNFLRMNKSVTICSVCSSRAKPWRQSSPTSSTTQTKWLAKAGSLTVTCSVGLKSWWGSANRFVTKLPRPAKRS